MPDSEGYFEAIYDDFSGGEFGKVGPYAANPNQFHGNNMLVYADRSIGPRGGIASLTPASMPNGKLLALRTTSTPTRDGLFIIGNTVYVYDIRNLATAPTSIGTFAVTPNQLLYPIQDDAKFYVSVPGDKTYKIDVEAGTVTGLSGSPGGHACAVYDSQLVVAEASTSAATNRISASDPGDFNSWPGNFVDIGNADFVSGIFTQRNYLAILKRTGIYLLSGVIGASSMFVRRISDPQTMFHPWQAVIDQDANIWYMSLFRDTMSAFDGARSQLIPQITPFPTREDDTAVPVPPMNRGMAIIAGDMTTSSLMIAQSNPQNLAALRHNGIWSYHHFETPITGMLAYGADDSSKILLTDGGGTSSPATIYWTDFSLNRPAFESDGIALPGDASNTPLAASLAMPYIWAHPTRRIRGAVYRVRQITIDATCWDQGTGGDCTLTANVTAVMRPDAPDTAYAPITNSIPMSQASTSGVNRRFVFSFEGDYGRAMAVSFTNIVGISIHRITVGVESEARDPRA